ncbi:hypothetical protein [Streptomyces formicae]|uniref:Tetratricopeptide repeat protein n=1 Tax=Streptomyces formicae TaxID=1616117 RepID=A0A291Q957_9ACTN|nr:hypothetical protein [Streptomyces formicae]ATL28027.1 hypothetical protein KY5_3009c [Streptomyces formicae]
MTTTEYLDHAIAVAEEMLLAPSAPRRSDRDRLADYVKYVGRPEPAAESQQGFAEQLTHLAKLLGALGMKTLSLNVAGMTLRHMEISEADREVYGASVWNELGALFAEHGELERSRLILCCALSRAKWGSDVPERGRILANLGAVSLRMGHIADAEVWAGKALRELDTYGGDEDREARMTADWVLLEVARERADITQLDSAMEQFDQSSDDVIRLKGGDHPTAIAARRALATAKYEKAAASHDVERSEHQLGEMEIVKLNASALLGARHRETIVSQAALAVAEFDAASGGSGSLLRRQRAVCLLETAEEMAVDVLGRGHAQTLAIREALAHLREATVQPDDLPYLIDRTYTPQQNDLRNEAKRQAIDAELNVIRLIAHAGASYFLDDLDIFYWQIRKALQRGVLFHVILSSPWNNLAIFMHHGTESDRACENIVDRVKASDYYRKTYVPVIRSYLALRKEFPGQVELKLTPTDLSGSTLITSEVSFFEPYITTNPQHRTRRGLMVFEHRFRKDSKYYADSQAAFLAQWELTSTWEQFGVQEERHKGRLRALLATQSDDRLSKNDDDAEDDERGGGFTGGAGRRS